MSYSYFHCYFTISDVIMTIFFIVSKNFLLYCRFFFIVTTTCKMYILHIIGIFTGAGAVCSLSVQGRSQCRHHFIQHVVAVASVPCKRRLRHFLVIHALEDLVYYHRDAGISMRPHDKHHIFPSQWAEFFYISHGNAPWCAVHQKRVDIYCWTEVKC